MKKALSLALALMMLVSMVCVVPVMAAEPDGSAENPYYVANPMTAPDFITIPANSTVYYQYKAAVFGGWEVGGYGLSAITVDGVVYDTPDMWGEIYAPLNFTFMSPGIVGYVNDTAEDVEVMISHNEPYGTANNPGELVEGDNTLTIPANVFPFYAVYVPMVNGEYTFACEQTEDFAITIDADGDFADGVYETLKGSLTLTLESYVPVQVTVSPMGITPDVTITVTAPKQGTEGNPIWLKLDTNYTVSAGEDTYFNVDGSWNGNTLVMESVAGADFTALVDGVEYASEGGVLSCTLDTNEWLIELILSSAVDNEVVFSMDYAAGAMENPIVLENGDNAISIPENGVYYYTYSAETDGLLVLTPADASVFGLLDIYYEDAEGNVYYGYLAEGASSAMLPVSAGVAVTISACGVMDEDTFINGAVDTTLNVTVKDLVLYNTFEGADSNGDLEGWASSSELALEESNVANGFYSAAFNVTQSWGNIYRYVNVEKNTNYEVSFKAMAAVADKVLSVKFNDNWSADVDEATVTVGTEWAEYSVVVNSGDFETLVLLLQYNGEPTDGQTYWLDDIVITKGEATDPDQPEEPAIGLINGDFETGDITGWQTHQSVNVTADAAHDGSYGAHLHGNGSWGGIMDQTVSVEAGKTYELSFWIKVNNFGVNLQIKDGDASGANLATGTWYDKNNHADWTLKTYVLNPSTNGIFLNFCGGGGANPNPNAEEDVYVDSIKVRELKAPSFDGYIYNGDLETGDTQSWESVWNNAQMSMVEGGHNSDYAMQIVYPGQWQIVRQKVSVKPNTNYVFGAYTKNAQGVVLLVKSAPADQNIKQNGISGSDDWKKHSVEFNSGDCTEVFLCVMSNNAGDSVIIDDFFLFEKKEASNDGYIINGTFETGDIAPWDNLWGSCPKAEIVSGGKDDSFALEIVSGEWKHVRQTGIAVEANTDYRITVWVKNSQNMALLVKDNGDSTNIVNVGVDAAGEWTEKVVEFNSGEYTSILVSFMGNTADAYGTFDNIVMEKIADEPAVVYGDANGDGAINNRDVALLQQYINKWEVTLDLAAADANGDGAVNNRDVALLQQYINKWEVTLGPTK